MLIDKNFKDRLIVKKVLILSSLLFVSEAYADNCVGATCLTNGIGTVPATAGLFSAQATSATDYTSGNPSTGTTVPVTSLSALSNSSAGGTVIENTPPGISDNSVQPRQVMRPRPPLEPNAFQNSVQIRTGLNLKQYGYDQFNLPDSFTPVNNTPVDSNYTLGPGDQIFIQGWGSLTMSYTATVSSEGTIYIPQVGTFNVAGIKAGSLEGYLKNKIGSVFKKFQLSATVSKIRSIQVNISGYAQVPGTYTLSSLSSISNAVFSSGGPSAEGSLRHIQLRRNGYVVKDFDMYQIMLKGDNSSDIRLLPGDIIYFMPKGNEVAIYDGVKIPAIYETKKGETVADVLKFAGGTSFDNSRTKVVIEQMVDHSKIVVNDYPYKEGLGQMVDNSNIIHFMRMNKQYDQTVVLIGNVANPTRLKYTPGMTVQDVIPQKSALLTSSFWNSYSYNTYGKDNVLTNTGLEKSINRSRDNSPSYNNYSQALNTSTSDTTEQAATKTFSNSDNLLIAGPVNIPEADINWNYASIIRINPDDYSTHVIAFNLAKAIQGDPQNNIQLQAGDVINILSSKDVRNPIDNHPTFVFIDGEVQKPGVYEVPAGESMVALINLAGGLTKRAYLFGMEVDRLSAKKKQQIVLNQMLDQAQQALIAQSSAAGLSTISPVQIASQQMIMQQQQALLDKMRQITPVGRVVVKIKSSKAELSDLPPFEMENGDTVYIPPLPHSVDVIGQVFNPATFSYDSSLNVNDYIEMAGTENDFADTSNEYVLQANGMLYSRKQAGWFGGFGYRGLNPGDTIIVPQLIQFGGTVQNLMNWTQILANFGTTAAAIQVFK